jgi:alpha-ketoglutarate-dependent taurine dioxygenase
LFRLQVQDRIDSHNGLRVIDNLAEQRYLEGEDVHGVAIDGPLAKVYPLVWTCPVTNRYALMPHPRCMHALEQTSESGSRFLGVIESRRKVEESMRPAIAPELVYVHPWQPGDLVIWDNRSTWHSATGKLSRDDRRVMHLTAFNSANPPRCNWQIGGT